MSDIKIQPVITAWSIGKCASSPASYQDQASRHDTIRILRHANFKMLIAQGEAYSRWLPPARRPFPSRPTYFGPDCITVALLVPIIWC